MLSKKIAGLCIFVLTISFLTVYAHQAPDPGPTIIEGHAAGMTSSQDAQIGYDRKICRLLDVELDSQRNVMLAAGVNLTKRLYYEPGDEDIQVGEPDYYATGGTATASVLAAATVSGFVTRGDYYIKARARGKWLWGSEKRKNSYRNGTSQSVPKSASREDDNATWSGVHLWGKAEVDNQFGDALAVFEWL